MAKKPNTNPERVKLPDGASLAVVALREGFRRAGRAFGRAETVIPIAELSPEEIEALRTEPMLAVSIRLAEPSAPAA